MHRRINALLTVAAFLFSVFSFAPPAAAQKTKTDADNLSPEVLRQISSILLQKRQSTELRQQPRKLSLQLEAAAKSFRGESLTNEVNSISHALITNDKGYVAVDIKADVSEKLLAEIKQRDGEIISVSAEDNVIQVYLPLWELENIAADSAIKSIEAAQKGRTNRAFDKQRFSFGAPVSQIGAVTSQGDVTHRADRARSFFNVNGAGVKIGVLSDSVRFLERSQSTGDLPANVTVIPGQSGILADGGDIGEGTAMLEIIHDIAPGAQLYFATAFADGFQSPATFANNIRALRNAGCNIIVDDAVATFGADGTPFQDVVVAGAINDVTASGVLYFSSAGNAGNLNDGTSGVWEGDFSDSGIPLVIDGQNIGTLHNFGGTTQNVVTGLGFGIYLLYWSDPVGAAANDYDLFLVSPDGTQLIAASANEQNGDDFPVEGFGVPAAQNLLGSRLLVTRFGDSQTRALHLNSNRGRLAIGTSGQIRGHNGAANAFSIAATPAGPFTPSAGPVGPFPRPFSFFNEVERFSSDGNRRIFFNPNGSPITPNNFLFASRGGRLLNKPDYTAADGVSTTFPGNSGLNPFFGTSASAPHAAAIAALVKSANRNLSRQQIAQILNNSAIDIEAFGRDRDAGAGIIDAFRAVSQARGGGSSGSCSSRIENGICTVTRCVNGNCTTETFPPTPSRPCSCQI